MKSKQTRDYSLVLDIEHIKPLKRFLSFIFDAVLFIILSFFFFGIAGDPIISNMEGFKKQDQIQNECIKTIDGLFTDSKLSIVDSDGGYSNELALKKYIDNKLNDRHESNGVTTDIFVYFYTTYCNDNLTFEGSKTSYSVSQINEEFYKYNDSAYSKLWKLNNGDISLPVVLTEEAKTEIKRYQNNEIDSKSQQFFVLFDNQVRSLMADAGNKLLASDQYIDAQSTYNESYYGLLTYYSVASIIIYVFVFILYYAVLPLVFKDGKTVAKFCLGYGVYTKDKHYAKNKNILLRTVILFVSYFFLVSFIPFLHIGLNCFSMPILIINSYVLTMIIPFLITILLCLVSFVFIGTTANYQSLFELSTNTIVGKFVNKPKDDKGGNNNEN